MVFPLTRAMPLLCVARSLFFSVFLRNHDLVTWM